VKFGIPYASRVQRGGKWFAICPTCKAKIELRDRKDWESFSGIEYSEHHNAKHEASS
jgi:hypothetical protein